LATHTFIELVTTAFLSCAILHAQSAGGPASSQPDALSASQLSTSNLAFEPVGPGDLIYISVAGSPELSRSYRVSAEGAIALPLLRESVHISGLLSPAISDAVAKEFVRERVLIAPIVSTSVLDYRSRTVSIVGAVKLPVTIQALGNMTLLDAIARAQGISPEAGPDIVVSRPDTASGGIDVLHVPIKALLAGTNPALNLSLHGGEEIRVIEAPKLYVVGNVKTPGTYPLVDLEGSSVLKILALSQGVLPYTAKEAYVYRSVSGSKDRQEIAIDLTKILHRKTPDFPLLANDILYIPDNSKMRMGASVLNHMAGFGSSTASGLVWH